MVKQWKRAAAILAALVLMMSLLPTALAAGSVQGLDLCAGGGACPLGNYVDLDPAAWYHDGVHYCLAAGLIQGDQERFSPDAALTRGQLVTILWRLSGSPAVNCAMNFKDVEGDTWYTEAVRWAASEGIALGDGAGRFAPETPVTRQELAAFLYRCAQAEYRDVSVGEETNILSYSDTLELDAWAVPALQWAAGAGILQGSGGALMPTAGATRAQAAVMISRYIRWIDQAELAAPEALNHLLYSASVRDAVSAEPDEIYPLVCLTHEDDRTTWDEKGERVLLLSLHHYPGSYPAGEDISFAWGPVWAFSGEEMADWYAENGEGVTDWSLRLNQLMGLPPDKGHTHITAFWVDPEDVIRPAYTTDATAQMAPTLEKDWEEGSWYDGWFEENIRWSYSDSAYPWTRLGYTYDWADNGSEYGLTEFLVYLGTEVTIEYTVTVEEFIAGLAAAENSAA